MGADHLIETEKPQHLMTGHQRKLFDPLPGYLGALHMSVRVLQLPTQVFVLVIAHVAGSLATAPANGDDHHG